MSKHSSNRNTPSHSSSQNSSYYSRSPSPISFDLKKDLVPILANDFYYKIALVIFIVLTIISLSISFPENNKKVLKWSFVDQYSYSMKVVTQILFVLSLIYIVAAFIVRRGSNKKRN